jgi:hypothetical protein
MSKPLTMFGMLSWHVFAPRAASRPSSEIQIYAGEVFGDHMTETSISGSAPRPNESTTFGRRYTYEFTDIWGTRLSAGYSPSHAARLDSGNSDLGLTTVDVEEAWTFAPGHKVVGYPVTGVGYAWTFDVRYPYLGKLVSSHIQALSTAETTSGSGVRI